MCQFMSGLIIDKGKKVIWDLDTDSHEDLIKKSGLKDETESPNFVRVELLPPDGDIFNHDLSKWNLHVDQDFRPDWFDKEKSSELMRKVLKKVIEERFVLGKKEEIRDGRWFVGPKAQIENVYGSAQIKNVCGSAQIEYVYDSAQIENVYGSAQIEYVYGSAQIENVYGSAQIEYVCGSAQIEYVYDSAQIRKITEGCIKNLKTLKDSGLVICENKIIVPKGAYTLEVFEENK